MRKPILSTFLISLLYLLSTNGFVVVSQSSRPDYVSLDFETVPNVLLVEMTNLEPTAEGVYATFTLTNPLRTLYLPFDLSGDFLSLNPVSEAARIWQSVGLIPPAGLEFPGTSLEFRVQFTSSAQLLRVTSSLIDLRSVVFNGVEVASNYFIPGLDSAQLVTVFVEAFVQFEQSLAAIAASAGCLIDTPTIAQLPACTLAAKDIFGSDVFQQMMLLILNNLGVNVGQDAISTLVNGIEFVEKLGNISDGLIYIGLSMSGGELSNRLVLQPMTRDPRLLPPWPPRPISPLEVADSVQPTFTWHSSPDVDGYEVQVSTNVDYAVPVIQSPLITETTFLSPVVLEPNQMYYWRVRAFSQLGGYSPWSTSTFLMGNVETVVEDAGSINTPHAQSLGAEPITSASADRVSELARLGRGVPVAIKFSPNGETLAVATSLGVWLYEAHNLSAAPRVLVNEENIGVADLVFSPDETMLAAFGTEIRVWDIQTGEQRPIVGEGIKWIADVGYGAESTCVGTNGGLQCLRWLGDRNSDADVPTMVPPEQQEMLTALNNYGESVTFSPNGSQLAIWGSNHPVRLLNLVTGQQHNGPVGSMGPAAFAPNGLQMATRSRDGAIWVLDTASATQQLVLPGDFDHETVLDFNPDGTLLAISTASNVTLWDMATGNQRIVLDGGAGELAFSPDGIQLATGSTNGSLLMWDVASGEMIDIVAEHMTWVTTLGLNASGTHLVTGSSDHTVRLWELLNGSGAILTEEYSIDGYDQYYQVVFSPEGSFVATHTGDGHVALISTPDGASHTTLGQSTYYGLAFSPDGTFLAFSDIDGIRMFDVANGQTQFVLPAGRVDTGVPLVLSPDGSLLATANYNSDYGGYIAQVWNIASGEQYVQKVNDGQGISSLAFSPDNSVLAIASDTLLFLDVATGTLQGALDVVDWPSAIAFSPDGSLLAAGGEDIVWLIDAATGEVRAQLQASGRITSLMFSQDGAVLATGYIGTGTRTAGIYDGIVRLWGIPGNSDAFPAESATNRHSSLADASPPLTFTENSSLEQRILGRWEGSPFADFSYIEEAGIWIQFYSNGTVEFAFASTVSRGTYQWIDSTTIEFDLDTRDQGSGGSLHTIFRLTVAFVTDTLILSEGSGSIYYRRE